MQVLLVLFFCFLGGDACGCSKDREGNGRLTSLDHKELSGRWYLFMDTRNNIIRDNTYGDFEIASNGKLMISLYRYFPDLEDCRTTSFMLQPLSSDPSPEVAVEFDLIRKSTKEKHGKQVILFIDNDPETGFVIMHLKTRINAYLVVTRSKNPSNKSAVIASIETAFCDLGLDAKEFATKSTNYGEGFYAYISSDLANPGGGHTLVYDVVVTNFRNGYNTHTGVFTVSVDGLYSLTWVTRVACSTSYTSQLYANKRIVGSTFAYCGYNTVTGNAVVQLRKGDVVFVRTLSGSGKIRSNEYGRTSFSGFLVK